MRLKAEKTTIRTENTNKVIVAFVYLGGGDNEPNSQVARMPPELVMIKPMAMAVARLTCGAALFALHVDNAGAEQYVPVMDRKRLPYCTDDEVEPIFDEHQHQAALI